MLLLLLWLLVNVQFSLEPSSSRQLLSSDNCLEDKTVSDLHCDALSTMWTVTGTYAHTHTHAHTHTYAHKLLVYAKVSVTFCIFFLELVLFITYIRACHLCVCIFCVFALFEFACRCHCHQLPGETHLQNDLLFVELSAMLSNTHSVSVQHTGRSPTGFLWIVYSTEKAGV